MQGQCIWHALQAASAAAVACQPCRLQVCRGCAPARSKTLSASPLTRLPVLTEKEADAGLFPVRPHFCELRERARKDMPSRSAVLLLLSSAQLMLCLTEAAAVNDTRSKHMDQAWLGKFGRQQWGGSASASDSTAVIPPVSTPEAGKAPEG